MIQGAKRDRVFIATKSSDWDTDRSKIWDAVFESQGVKVIVDPKSLIYLDGTEVDFAKEGLNEGFKFTNPNAKDECGCGESFTV